MKYTKDFARYYIGYQDNLSENDKSILLNFVNEASVEQIKVLLYTGQMVDESLISEAPAAWDPTWVNPRGHGYDINAIQSRIQSNIMKFDKAKIALKKHYDGMATYAKKTYVGADLKRELASVKSWRFKAQKELTNKYVSANKPLLSSMKAAIRQAKKVGATGKDVTASIAQGKQRALDKAAAKLKAAADEIAKQKAFVAKNKAAIVKSKAFQAKVTVGGSIVIAAGIAAASYQIYKRFLSKSARACSNKSGAVKTLCMQQYKKKATQARIRNMQSQMKQCDKTNNPAKCKAATMSTMKRLRAKISEGTVRDYARYHILNAYDLTEDEKVEALEGVDLLEISLINTVVLSEGSDEDIANYYKHRNKLRKVGLRKGVKNPGAVKHAAKSSKANAKVLGKVAKGAKKKSFGSKIAAKILKYAKKKGLLAKAAKIGKVAAKSV